MSLPKMKTIHLPLFLLSLTLASCDTSAQSSAYQCDSSSAVVDFVIKKIDQSDLATSEPLACSDIKKLASVNPSLIELTTGRKNGVSVICIGTNRDFPCQFVVGRFNDSLDPTTSLASIFSVSSRDPEAPLNETVERLFIRPAALIR
jgi:hypothetical protein